MASSKLAKLKEAAAKKKVPATKEEAKAQSKVPAPEEKPAPPKAKAAEAAPKPAQAPQKAPKAAPEPKPEPETQKPPKAERAVPGRAPSQPEAVAGERPQPAALPAEKPVDWKPDPSLKKAFNPTLREAILAKVEALNKAGGISEQLDPKKAKKPVPPA